MFGTLESQEIEDVLLQQTVGRLGCSASGRTYIVPISYAYDGSCLYFHTASEGEKIEIMRSNPEVCFQVDTMENMANWKSVICWGSFEELHNERRRAALKLLLHRQLPLIASQTVKISPNWPFEPGDYNQIEGIVFRICITEKTGRYETIENTGERHVFV